MADLLTIVGVDTTATYTNLSGSQNQAFNPIFRFENNNETSDTLGFQIKVQKGNERIRCTLEIIDTQARLNAKIFPLETAVSSVDITFDRTIPKRNSKTARFQVLEIDVINQFDSTAGTMQASLDLVEVLNS